MYLGTDKARETVLNGIKRLNEQDTGIKILDDYRKKSSNKFLMIFSVSIIIFTILAWKGKWYKLPQWPALIIASTVSLIWCVILEHYAIVWGGWNYFYDYTYIWVVPVQNYFLYLFSTVLGVMFMLRLKGVKFEGNIYYRDYIEYYKGWDISIPEVFRLFTYCSIILLTYILWFLDYFLLKSTLTYFTLMLIVFLFNIVLVEINKCKYSVYGHREVLKNTWILVLTCYVVEVLTASVSWAWIVDADNTLLMYLYRWFDWQWLKSLNDFGGSINLQPEEFMFYYLFVNIMYNVYYLARRNK